MTQFRTVLLTSGLVLALSVERLKRKGRARHTGLAPPASLW